MFRTVPEVLVGEGVVPKEPGDVAGNAVWLTGLTDWLPLKVAVIEKPDGVGVPLVGPAVATAPIPPI